MRNFYDTFQTLKRSLTQKSLLHILLLFLFLTNEAHLIRLYKCLEMDFGAILAYLLYHR